MPFILTNVPSTFQPSMNMILSPLLRKFVAIFFDDILIYSKTMLDHCSYLRQVLQTLRDNQFLVKKSKCYFGQKLVEYLGHMVSTVGVSMDIQKLQAILDWRTP